MQATTYKLLMNVDYHSHIGIQQDNISLLQGDIQSKITYTTLVSTNFQLEVRSLSYFPFNWLIQYFFLYFNSLLQHWGLAVCSIAWLLYESLHVYTLFCFSVLKWTKLDTLKQCIHLLLKS